MITMSKAATNTSSSSEDDGNNGNLQGIYDKDERFTSADYILLYIIDMYIRPDFSKG